MHNLLLSDDELEDLEAVMDDACRRTLVEIHRTDHARFRNEVERKSKVRQGILERIKELRKGATVSPLT